LVLDSFPRVPVSVLWNSHPWAYPRRAEGDTQPGIQARVITSRGSASRRATRNTAGRCHLTAFSGNLNAKSKSERTGGRNGELLIVFRKLFTNLFPGASELVATEDRFEGFASLTPKPEDRIPEIRKKAEGRIPKAARTTRL